jgi:hypothetical protein
MLDGGAGGGAVVVVADVWCGSFVGERKIGTSI